MKYPEVCTIKQIYGITHEIPNGGEENQKMKIYSSHI